MSTTDSDAPLRKLDREPLWDRAHSQLREALLAGRFEPGSGLTLRFLAETFGTSVTPVRDAVTRLVAQGVLRQGPRNSAIVPDVGVEELRHLTIVRCELEGRGAFEAAHNATPTDIRDLENALDQMAQSIAAGEYPAYLDAHRRFHFGIYAVAAIPPLTDMIENLWLRCGPVLSFVAPDYVRSLRRQNHHVTAWQAIRDHDPAAARAAIVADIEQAVPYLQGLMDAEGRIRRPQERLPTSRR